MSGIGRPEPGGTPPVLADRYELGQLLGTGGMGEVYRAVDRVLERPVAVKLLPGGGTPDRDGAERLRREAKAAALLNHPNVVAVHDVGRSGDTVFVVMEYLEGRSLKELVADEWPLPPDRVITIVDQVCDALGTAHDSGLVHRDVSPGNIMVGPVDRVKLTDFGTARITGGATTTATGVVVGTPAYMSPEQVEGVAVDGRSDLYSLGCCLYFMLTRQPPFSGATAVETAYQHLRATPQRPSALHPGIPPELEAVTLTAMAKSPDDRYQNAREMSQALRHCRADATTPAVVPASTRPLPMNVNRPGESEPADLPDALDVAEPDEGRVRRRVGLTLIVVAAATLVAIAVLLLYQKLGG